MPERSSWQAWQVRAKSLGFAGWDAVLWPAGIAAAAWLRFGDTVGGQSVLPFVLLAVTGLTLQVIAGLLLLAYRGRSVLGTIDDAINVVTATVVVGLVLTGLTMAGVFDVPSTVPVIGTLIALVLGLAPRAAMRLLRERRARPDASSASKVIVFGAGTGGQQMVRSMLADAESGYLPVALLDDDPAARSRRVSGVPVRGTRADIDAVATETGASLLVVAIRELDVESMREISRIATSAGLRVKVVPALQDLFRPWVGFDDLRDLDIADLLGRKPVEVDVTAIAGYLADKTVLVTGAGGSIGSELCRQVRNYGPASLLMLDRDESALHALQLSMDGRAMLDSPDVILADIRDAAAMRRIFRERRPDVVFHAAALKHLPMLEQYPHEAWQSNVLGTQNVLDAAMDVGVDRFVNISTDKAANPVSVLGYSKRIGERLVASAATRAGTRNYLSVRFGNVLGSRGSVLTTFTEQLLTDSPLTVTHPDVTRFFMTIPEAVRLVIQAAAIGRPGEALVLDMGDPVRIADVARQLTVIAGRSVQILYTGLRDGEKLHEELFGDGEVDERPMHPAVSHVPVPALDDVHVLHPVKPDEAADVMASLVVADNHSVPDQRTARVVSDSFPSIVVINGSKVGESA